jgi:ABC-2 type transport system permease protein
MKTLLFLLEKEFLQVFRNKTMLPIIFVVPLVQLIILVNAATMEMKHIKMFVVDKDLTSTSRNLVNNFKGSPFFTLQTGSFSLEEAEESVKMGNSDLILHIPSGFEKHLVRDNKASVQILINAINGTVAGISNYYAQSIISDYNRQVITKWKGIGQDIESMQQSITVIPSYWYNPELNYKNFMVPAVLVMLTTIIGMILSALNLVREKEIGTIEQINVTPIHKYQFILGKLIPILIIGLMELTIGLTVGKLIFHIPILGSIALVYLVATFYLAVVLGIGLFNSTITHTQQQAMFISFFTLLIFVMMSGVFTPTESMPAWAQLFNHCNPVMYFMKAIRMILLKGSGIKDILGELLSLLIYGICILSLAVWRYRKVA